tara:strand:+ start:583 stop:723 length:141 start_codon:yes stop_codon:yes gene_type:complete
MKACGGIGFFFNKKKSAGECRLLLRVAFFYAEQAMHSSLMTTPLRL